MPGRETRKQISAGPDKGRLRTSRKAGRYFNAPGRLTYTEEKEVSQMYNLTTIMRRAWEIRRQKGFTLATALRLAWREAKGEKGYAFKLENARALITAYLVKLLGQIADIHDVHKVEILRAALLLPCDSEWIAVTDGKTVGVCKYAMRNA